jgi:exodeoxyribonuclease VII large subunit
LDRGYAVVQLGNGSGRDVIRHPDQAPPGTSLLVRVAEGRFGAVSSGDT